MDFKEKYEQYLQTYQWKALRVKKANSVKYRCELCGKEKVGRYEIHHKTYARFMHERLSDLMFLCVDCHKVMHKISRNKMREIQDGIVEEIKISKPQRACKNCKYSAIISYKGANRQVLYCNKKNEECDEACEGHHYGAEKEIDKDRDKKQLPKKRLKKLRNEV